MLKNFHLIESKWRDELSKKRKIFTIKTFLYDNKARIKRVVKKSKTNGNWKWRNEKMIPWHEGSRDRGNAASQAFSPRKKRQMEDEIRPRWNRKGKTRSGLPQSLELYCQENSEKRAPIESLRRPSTPPPKANNSDESSENIYLFT